MNQEPLTPEEMDEIAAECFQDGLDFIADSAEIDAAMVRYRENKVSLSAGGRRVSNGGS